jgi:hypothetical protein
MTSLQQEEVDPKANHSDHTEESEARGGHTEASDSEIVRWLLMQVTEETTNRHRKTARDRQALGWMALDNTEPRRRQRTKKWNSAL